MKEMGKKVYGWCIATAALSAAVLLFAAWLPSSLSLFELSIRRARARFETEEDRRALMAQAEIFEESIFESLYNVDDEPIKTCLPPRGSYAHDSLYLLAWILSVKGEVASREDLMPSPPAPSLDAFLDIQRGYPVQMVTIEFFMGWLRLGSGAAVFAFALAAYLVRRRMVRNQASSTNGSASA